MKRQALVTVWTAAAVVLTGATCWGATISVDTFNPGVVPDGFCSLIEAMENADRDAAIHADCVAGDGGDVIELRPGHYMLREFVHSRLGRTGLPPVTGDLVIDGRGSTIHRSPGAPAFRILLVDRGGRLVANDLAVQGGLTESWGGGIFNFGGSLLLNRCRFEGNEAVDGGGLAILSGTAVLMDVVIRGNRATNDGGGITSRAVASDATLIAVAATVEDNEAGRFGGGIKNDAAASATSRVKLIDSTVRANRAGDSGGGIGQQPGTASGTMELEVVGGSVSENEAANVGGGVASWVAQSGRQVATVEIRGAVIADNRSGWGGGILGWYGGTSVTVAESTIADNRAAEGGGLIVGEGAQLDLRRSTVSGNSAMETRGASGAGGGLKVVDAAASIGLTTISGNRAMSGGGGIYIATDAEWIEAGSTVSIADCTIVDNEALGALGGGIAVERLSGNGFANVEMVGSILGRNQDIRGSGNCSSRHAGSLESAGHNVADDASCWLTAAPDAEGKGYTRLSNTDDVVDDLMLSDLDDFGGPTMTHMPLPGSPAIDIGSGGGLRSAVDQRGFIRTADGDGDGGCVCDAGAVEAASEPLARTPWSMDELASDRGW